MIMKAKIIDCVLCCTTKIYAFYVHRYLSFEYLQQSNMELYKQIAIFAIICTGPCLAVDPDWSCDFEEDKCGIIETEGSWSVTLIQGALRADVVPGSTGDMFIFSIPHIFTSPKGILSFEYDILGPTTLMSVKVCREASEPAFTVAGTLILTQGTEVISYSCARKMDVEITFIVIRGNVAPLIRVDNILIYETPYIVQFVTRQPSTVPISINLQSKAHTPTSSTGKSTTSLEDPSVTRQPSTVPISTNLQSKAHTPTSSTGKSTTSLEAPYAAISGGVAAAVVVVCIIIIILVYRCKCKPKQDQNNGSGLEEMAGGEAPPPVYKTTIVAFPEASGSDTLRINMENDQQVEIKDEYLTPRMKRGTMLQAENVEMNTRDNPVVMVTEDDAAGKNAVILKEAEYSVVI